MKEGLHSFVRTMCELLVVDQIHGEIGGLSLVSGMTCSVPLGLAVRTQRVRQYTYYDPGHVFLYDENVGINDEIYHSLNP